MASFNQAILIGNLTKDPDLRFIPSGAAVCKLTLACNRKWKDRATDQFKEDFAFIQCVLWGKTAEAAGDHLHKGDPLMVCGRIQTRSWEKEDGTKAYATEVVVEHMQFLNRGQKRDGGEQAPPADEPPAGDQPADDIPF